MIEGLVSRLRMALALAAVFREEEQDILPLAGGRVQDLDVLDTPVGRLGSLISKNAWMIDVNDRYDAKDANLILQPEAFSEWSYAPDSGFLRLAPWIEDDPILANPRLSLAKWRAQLAAAGTHLLPE